MSKPALSTTEFVALFSFLTSLTAASIDAMLPALYDIGQALQVAHANDTQLIVSMFIVGMVFGELIFGPLSDAIGRKKSIMAGLMIYSAGSIMAMTALSMEQLLAGRILQGIGVSGPKIASRALIRDLYRGEAMARIMSFIFTVFILVPMLAPFIGQGVLLVAHWRAIFVLYLLLALIAALWLGLRQAETLTPENRIRFSAATLLRNTQQIIKHRSVMAYTFAAGLIFGAKLLYLSTAQAMFIDFYNAKERFPFYFALLALGIGLASFLNGQFVTRYGMHRLSCVALIGLIAGSGVLLAVALLHQGVPPLMTFIALCFLMFFCIGMLFGNLNAMAMQWLGHVAGIGASLMASISSLVAVVLAVSMGRFYDQTAIPLAVGFLVAGITALALILATKKAAMGRE